MENTSNKVFLDLEETVITSFDEGLLCNLDLVKRFLTKHNTSKVSIFSFAIWNSKDREEFHRGIRRNIERGLGVEVISVPTVEEIAASIKRGNKTHFSIHDIISIWGKHRAFFDWCKFEEVDDCILLDDVVPNLILHDIDKGQRLQTINIKAFKNQ